MADQNCGCGTNGSSPPGTTLPTVSSPVGSVSSYGGNAMVARGPCRPAQCPTPPVSDVPERVPYCASWTAKLTTKVAGMLVMVLEGCLYKLWSKCSGFVYYDRESEQISVQDPKFVSAVPKETSFGFLAKVVPTVHTVCVDGQDSCQQEIRQELASQVMGMASCGDLVIARAPLCGDVPVQQSGDLAKQVRFDVLDPPDHEDAGVGCPEVVRFLVSYPGTRGPSNGAVACKQWSEMYRLKLRGSQWGFIPSGSPLEGSAKQVVLTQVAGGTDADPCFELRALESGQGGLPSDPDNCSTIIFRGKGTVDAGWKEAKNVALFHGFDAPVNILITNSGGTKNVTLPNFPEDPCGPVWPVFQTEIFLSNINNSVIVNLGAYRIAGCEGGASQGGFAQQEARARVTSASVAFTVTLSAGALNLNINLIGYYY